MNRVLVALSLTLILSTILHAADEDRGTYLGVLVCPRPSEGASRAAGVVITHVIPGSPAAGADLRRHDILLRYDREPIRDGEHLARLIRADKPNRKVHLLVLRGDRQHTLAATLTLGPPLRLSPPAPSRPVRPAPAPAAVTLYAAPQDSGKMRLTIEYYDAGKRQVISCNDVATEVDSAVKKLPQRERDLVRIALERLNRLNTEKTPARP